MRVLLPDGAEGLGEGLLLRASLQVVRVRVRVKVMVRVRCLQVGK